uniref:Uncharacterized protein n=1 Tax=Solanum tuberosum TaxID=4113 RepID=M1B052_SOLTU
MLTLSSVKRQQRFHRHETASNGRKQAVHDVNNSSKRHRSSIKIHGAARNRESTLQNFVCFFPPLSNSYSRSSKEAGMRFLPFSLPERVETSGKGCRPKLVKDREF